MDCLRTRRTAPTAGPLPGTRGAIFLPSISFPPATPVSPPGAHWQCGPTACCAWPLRCRRGREEWGGVCRALRVVLEGRALGETGVGSHDTAQLTGCFLCPAADTCRRQRIGRGGGWGRTGVGGDKNAHQRQLNASTGGRAQPHSPFPLKAGAADGRPAPILPARQHSRTTHSSAPVPSGSPPASRARPFAPLLPPAPPP